MMEHNLEDYIQPYLTAGDFSGIILIAQKDNILIQKAYGCANSDAQILNKLDTKFRIASLTKTFTAAAIVLLLEGAKLTLSTPLSAFLPNFPHGEKITIKHLLMHASGVGALDSPEVYLNELSTEELLAHLRKTPPQFEPGSNSRYSNEGYFLLAVLIERISGVSYETFLQEQFFQPLGIHDMGNMLGSWDVGNHATGYVPSSQGVLPLAFDPLALMGAGSLYATAPDLLRWMNALRTNQFIHFDKLPYPVGWGKRNYEGHDLIEQSGLVEGFTAYLALYPKEEFTVVFLSNIQSGLFNRIAKDMACILFGGELSRPPIHQQVSLDVADYAGEYTTPAVPVPMNMVIQDGDLFMRWGDYPFLRFLTPIARDHFFLRAEYADVGFERDPTGKVIQSTWIWDHGEPLILSRRS